VIPVNEPLLSERELEYVTECVKSGWISSAGKYIDEFERLWAERCGRAHGVAVSNGTVALQLAVTALGLEPGDEIIMPSFTIVSCGLAAVYSGCKPVLVDCDEGTWCMKVEDVEARATDATKAVMPVHIYGHPVDMDPLLDLAASGGWKVIEDAAEAHGALYRSGESWNPCGGMGDLSTFSFYANKLVTTGEGGMVLTDDAQIAERARRLRNLGFQEGRRFFHEELGFNFRMTNLQAALGVAQVERFPDIVERKRRMGARYRELLADVAGIRLQVEEPWARSVYWMFGLVLDDDVGFDAVELADRLRSRGVDTRPFFLGLHEQPAFHSLGLFRDERYPVTERIARRGLYLPSGLALTDEDIDRVAEALVEAVSE
jgi:perosamine synthetase